MSIAVEVPHVNARVACIVHHEDISLAAVLSSYLFVKGSYTPLFSFPKAKVSKQEDPPLMSEAYATELFAGDAGYVIGNALARLPECEYVILAGLNEHQKSYLRLPTHLRVIEVASASHIQAALSPLALPIRDELRCKSSDLLSGLLTAQKYEKRLVIDDLAEPVSQLRIESDGLIVIEGIDTVSSIVAINYASAMGAATLIVDELTKSEAHDIPQWLQAWKERNELAQLAKLEDSVVRRVRAGSLTGYGYVTFFTEGLPYSAILGNSVASSYVNLSLRPDLFILNSIRGGDNFHSAVVFSPVFFEDEETQWLREFFPKHFYYLTSLVGKGATVANFDFYAQYFPFDILHICSHGGEVKGYEMSETFVDQDGVAHVVEFEEVVGFSPALDDPTKVAVHRKAFPRKLDGFNWMSAELEAQNLPSHVSLTMWKTMLESHGRRTPKGRIAMSCAIACTDSIHQGELHTLASFSSPFVFNNTCWSWDEVAKFFIACGARGYIGTLGNIGNNAAVTAAQTFYENALSETVLSSFHKAVKSIESTTSKDIYVYWGLPFTRLSASRSARDSRAAVRNEIGRSIYSWTKHIEATQNSERRTNSIRVLKRLLSEFKKHFGSPQVTSLEEAIRKRIPELSGPEASREIEQLESTIPQPRFEYLIRSTSEPIVNLEQLPPDDGDSLTAVPN